MVPAPARQFERSGTPSWFVRRTAVDRILSFLVWLAIAAVLYIVCFPRVAPQFGAPYLAFVVYFSWLYHRLLSVPMWAADTLRVLEAKRGGPAAAPARDTRLLVLIAAYKAQSSIVPVLQALKHQSLPRDRFRVYVVTQAAENREKWLAYASVLKSASAAIRGDAKPGPESEVTLDALAELLGLCEAGASDPHGPIENVAAAGLMLGWDRRRLERRLVQALVADFFRRYARGESAREICESLYSAGVLERRRHVSLLNLLLPRCSARAHAVIADFSRILGVPGPASLLFPDPEKGWRTAAGLTHDRIDVSLRAHALEALLRRDMADWLERVRTRVPALRAALSALPDLDSEFRPIYSRLERTCPEVVDSVIHGCGPGFHHICREKEGGGKPESLNTAYHRILRDDPHWLASDVSVVVIDADSLLHSSALHSIAVEIGTDADRCAIRQIAPLSTSNYRGRSIFVKLICCLDTIGSMGKWARSTRTADRPDLPAGSGLVIPVNLLEFLRQRKGTPWDGSTITEDARLVISDYGLLDGATRKTRFVPIHLLEAVPEGPGFLAILRQYWGQRTRWASGGPEEVAALLQAFRSDSIYVQSRGRGGYSRMHPSFAQRLLARARHLRLLLSWIHDHLWWGPGYALAPVVWFAFAFFFITPSGLGYLGLALLLSLPAWTIFSAFRRFAWFVPGGLSRQDLVLLYCSALVFAWCHTWPVVYTHILYTLGKRERFKVWTPTAKPRF
jgi:cellulose synthase/poly-beta-1,6-N-acetylglucosamine synthase-like glycosyltransferase